MADLRGLNRYYGTDKRRYACFSNFMWVLGESDGTPAKLARASQPNYGGSDSEHTLTKEEVRFLKEEKIACLISANSHYMKEEAKKLLGNAGIAYFHFRTVDFTAPTSQQLQKAASAIELFSRRGATLVYCGYGAGRTGTFIAAWAMSRYLGTKGVQMDAIDAMCTPEGLRADFGVEERAQVNAVRTAVGLDELPLSVAVRKPALSGASMPVNSGPMWKPGPPAFSGGSSPGVFAKFSSGASWTPPPGLRSGGLGSPGYADDDNFDIPAIAKFSSGSW